MDPNPKPASSREDNNKAVLEHRSFARIGFLGNPSDPSDHLLIKPHPYYDLVRFDSLDNLVCRLKSEGYYGGVRLLMAICKVFRSYCKDNDIHLHDRNFTLSYDTNIPRQVSLLACFLSMLDLTLFLMPKKNLVLLQVFKTVLLKSMVVVLFTCKEHMERVGYGIYTIMDINLLPPLHLIYAENPSDSGKVHSTVRRKWLDGDEFIISSMAEIAKLAEEGRTALLNKDYTKLKELMNHECLGAMNIEMVEVARKIGAAAKFTGSGGAVVAFCPDGPSQVKLLEEECKKAGFIVEPVKLVPTRLNNSNLKTLSKP
ncbi:unnamed protein product [Brassica napus]|uniref:(rape) hypothetical protein n=1 Tax=Brassica napus TaxID=3708 RepID=A0A816J5C8_BRANA|nr:unnamed protein product [Brassica napus]